MSLIAFCVCVSLPYAQSQSSARPTMASEADFRRAMKELSNWGRWGGDDELGAANLITPPKRKKAVVSHWSAEGFEDAEIGSVYRLSRRVRRVLLSHAPAGAGRLA
jgi:hypothetical protein